MSKKMLIDATHAEETRVVVVDGNKVEEFDFETVNKRQLAGNIYLAKVTRVEPSLQAAFVDYGGNRHGFLAFAEIHPDYYQIPVADRKALIEEERALARAEEEEENRRDSRSEGRSEGRSERGDGRSRHRGPKPAPVESQDAVISEDLPAEAVPEAAPEAPAEAVAPVTSAPVAAPAEIGSMDVVDLGEDEEPHDHAHDNTHTHHDDAPRFRAIDHAADTDDEIESIAEEDVQEEISAPRKPRARRYKIQEVIKVRQIMLVQVVKEERGNKGAALTTYLSLAGRYCVLMPNTARGGGISRKITMAADRKKLKEIAGELEVPEGAGLIIRTAGAKRTKPEIKRDYEYLMRLWEEIRELTLKSIAPAKIYEEGDLIKRTIRDLYSREIDEILVEGEAGYRTAKDFMKMIMPAQSRVVQPYHDATPLFARYQVEGYLGGMFNPTVQLKSGGYIVIGVTEALVAIDVNSGRATKEGSIEETALKTNLEAAEEIARQLRLRDLAGLIVIDFIDMEERRNNLSVEKRLKDKLKTDRARIQVGRISGFGLLEMSRQRLRPGMLESTTQPCAHCHGTGLIRSDDSIGLQVLRALEEEGTRKRSKEVLLRAPIGIVNFLFNQKREHLALIEARYGMAVRIEADPHMIAPDFTIEKFKTATRFVPEAPVVSGNASLMGAAVEEEELDLALEEIEDEAEEEATEVETSETTAEAASGSGGAKKKRRRRRKKKPSGAGSSAQAGDEASGDEAGGDEGDDEGTADEGTEEATSDAAPAEALAEVVAEAPQPSAEPEAPKKRTRTSASRAKKPAASAAEAPAVEAAPEPAAEVVTPETLAPEAEAAAKPARKPATRSRAKKPAAEAVAEAVAGPVAEAAPASVEVAPPPVEAPSFPADPGLQPAPEAALVADPEDKPEPEDPNKPKRKGWWSLGR
ncbi:Rne/Rng family ribonuclease [Stagnihabitans tardus]|uniref:Ribonuclease E n=1 Tax=Stagnihabitans tardus TaxID=2699202 RepID=A0AAE5BVH3_9RHOB|nr:Rne/Rng family ribonuclease [Stagnihabitans tardus]NBZ87844.1 Rne/Rng family ribonuclease [Stagnihabitans tardus]